MLLKKSMTAKKKTSLELFATELYEAGLMAGNGDEIQEMLEKYIPIHRQEIEQAYDQDLYGGLNGHRKFQDGKEYYKETFEDAENC